MFVEYFWIKVVLRSEIGGSKEMYVLNIYLSRIPFVYWDLGIIHKKRLSLFNYLGLLVWRQMCT